MGLGIEGARASRVVVGRFVVEIEPVGATGPRDAGQRAARRAIAAIDPRAELGYDGARPVARYPDNAMPAHSRFLDQFHRSVVSVISVTSVNSPHAMPAPLRFLPPFHRSASAASAASAIFPISIAHTRTTAVAVASRDVALLGIDIVATDDPRLARVADRLHLGTEDRAAAFASIEARLKAHGHGILELLDGPPPELAVEICRIGNETIAIAYAPVVASSAP